MNRAAARTPGAAVAGRRARLLEAAERLIAERGEGVSLREIALAAGQHNNSAVNYHFGDRDGLIAAVLASRLGDLEPMRRDLLARFEACGRGEDPAALIEVLVRPMVELPYRAGATHYARFLERVRHHPALGRLGREEGDAHATVIAVLERLLAHLDHLPPDAAIGRLEAMASAMFALLADRERRRAEIVATADTVVAEVVSMLTALALAR